MYLSQIRIQNYRLLIDSTLDVDKSKTLIVGRNNTAKTSLLHCIENVLKNQPITYNDYPLSLRGHLVEIFSLFIKNELSFKDLCNQIKTTSVEFIITYSSDGDEDNLGTLSPFIIDIDTNTSTAHILAEYKFKNDEPQFHELFQEILTNQDNTLFLENVRSIVKKYFSQFFELTIYAINPTNNQERQRKQHKDLKELFPICIVRAERMLGEDDQQKSSLTSLISNFFNITDDALDPGVSIKINELKSVINNVTQEVQRKSDAILSTVVQNSVGFGYPNAEELQLGVITKLSIDDQIQNQTQLSYVSDNAQDGLPSTYNGLGYKNLIKMAFLLASFAKELENIGSTSLPLLFIEEPESHMHPQMQCSFTEYLDIFLQKTAKCNIQTLLTSHSAHIANTIDFRQIRYAKKVTNGIIYKNIENFALTNTQNTQFIKKYLTLTKCDLFFADKAILVEGASERLLLPDMINKCSSLDKTGIFNLHNQYYTILEVGGAYAHIFIPFIHFLGIPCLIITDIDSCIQKRSIKNNKTIISYPASFVSEGTTTSNAAIKWWYSKVKGLTEKDSTPIELSKIIAMNDHDKTWENCHLEFQTEEDKLCGRSLEEAIRNVNRAHYKIPENPTEKDIEFEEKSKTTFALDFIQNENYAIPAYIKSGLFWLNKQNSTHYKDQDHE